MIIKIIVLDYNQDNEADCELKNELEKSTFNTKNIKSKSIGKIINLLKSI